MTQTVKNIVDDYYAQFRGQASNLPTYPDREFNMGVILLRAAIQKWDRADGQLWRELFTTLAAEKLLEPTIIDTVEGALTVAPDNMRKPPAKVVFTLVDGRVAEYKTVRPQYASKSSVWFTGGANKGFIMHIGEDLLAELTDATFEYPFYRSPTMPTTVTDPSAIVIDMSDPSFAVQYMLASRFQNARNGFGYKTAMQEATNALANMKLEDSSGVYGNSEEMTVDTGWGTRGDTGFGEMSL
jgi:hypothetical protein